MKTIVILLAGGSGRRMNTSQNKILMPLCGKTVIRRSIEAFIGLADEMMIVTKPEEKCAVQEQVLLSDLTFPVHFSFGGETRQKSVYNGLMAIHTDDNDIVLIHDAARCLVDHSLIKRVIDTVEKHGTGVPGIPATSTYKLCSQDCVVLSTPDRSNLYEVQTPQGFYSGLIKSAAQKASDDHVECTDDSCLLEYSGIPVKIVPGSASNIKLTVPDDFIKASAILGGGHNQLRAGMGYDVHQLVPNRKLILCGIEINNNLGLLGHSDADVAIHALMDAMLGACGLGDIGKYFPDTDIQWKDASSIDLLKVINKMINEKGYYINNADITIAAQKPKLLPYIDAMTHKLQTVLLLSDHAINIKATTTEHLGFVGREEGISAYAVCTIVEK